ncbi:MAG: hypothetical protein NC489_24360 [Ruminococcus flavefaciens]|nr:hypothetical protein [Ruminococcus flavefaciens]
MGGYNPSNTTWLNPNIEYLFGDEIIEHDMKEAGFSLIKQYRLLPDEKIRELALLPKDERTIRIGMIQRDDKVFSQALLSKFAEMRKIFIETNHLTDDDIISVKKDAIFTVGTCRRIKFGGVEFVRKNTYSSYLRFPLINNLEIYYSSDGMDIKGMGDSAVNRHRLYMYEFIRTMIGMIEDNSSRAKRYLMKFVSDYKWHNLPDEYYLEFNSFSKSLNPIFNFQCIIVPFIQIVSRELN